MPRLVQIRPLDPSVLHHPAVVQQFNRRAADVQLRIADRVTAFAGSMRFVYLHAVLSTFVMIGQNRQASFQQAKADHDYGDINTLLVENTELTRIIHELTARLADHVLTPANPPSGGDEHRDRPTT